MKAVDTFSSFASHMTSDFRIQKYGIILVRQGTKGLARANPVLVWVDAGLAVCEAASAYFQYAAEAEVTKQLKLQTETLRKEIECALMELRLSIVAVEAHSEARLEFLELSVDEALLHSKNLRKKIASRMDHVRTFSGLVRTCRENTSHEFEELQTLQRNFDYFLNAALMCLAESVDN